MDGKNEYLETSYIFGNHIQFLETLYAVEILQKPNFIISIRYEIPTFSSVRPFSKRGRGRKFQPEDEILGIFSIEVAP